MEADHTHGLTDGAALIYTSATTNKNCDVLAQYLTHRLFGVRFTSPAQVVDRGVCAWLQADVL